MKKLTVVEECNSLELTKNKMLRNRSKIIYTGLIVLIIILVGSIIGIRIAQQSPSDDIVFTVEPWSRGPDNASVTIDLYTDFTCSICVEMERMAIRASDDFSGRIRLVYHHYPSTRLSEIIAEVLEAAGDQGNFWEMHDRLIDDTSGDIYQVINSAISVGLNEEEYAINKMLTEAEELGLNITQLIESLESGRFTQKVRTAKNEAVLAGVEHTSVFINGREFQNSPAKYDNFYAIVAEEIDKIGSGN